MKILLVEPFLGGSHRIWAEGFASASRHTVRILGMSGRYWKWRMQGAAPYLAGECAGMEERPDLILATDMLDAAAFRGLLPHDWHGVPFALYFHENQFAYPDADPDQTYPFINFRSVLAADRVFFNSGWNRRSFLEGARGLLKRMPDYRMAGSVDRLAGRCRVLPLGMDYSGIGVRKSPGTPPVVLWNHRWEEDKGVSPFFAALRGCLDLPFRLLLLGERGAGTEALVAGLEERILFSGYPADRNEYGRLLAEADLLPVTAGQDFFGISVLEAVAAGIRPLLPEGLAYPEHFPPDAFGSIYYSGALEPVLRAALAGPLEQPAGLRELALRYSWERIIDTYDREMEEVVS